MIETTSCNQIEATACKIEANSTSRKIIQRSATRIAWDAQKQRVSRRLLLTKHAERQTCVCEVTGIVSLLDIPAIPLPANASIASKMVLIYKHPLANLANARGLASVGLDYLRRLDTQILAGILIVLADSYDLFAYQPSDSGAQKNAILRTAGKDVIIDAILLIEDLIHSANNRFLPRLSLLIDSDILEGQIESRLVQWLKLTAEMIYSAERIDEDEFHGSAPEKHFKPASMRRIPRAKASTESKEAKAKLWAETNTKWAAQREFKADKLAARKLIPALAASNKISLKLLALIKGVFVEDTLLTMASEVRMLLASKVSDFAGSEAAAITLIIRKDRSALLAEEFDAGALDELDDLPSPVISSAADSIEADTTFAVSPQESQESPESSEDSIESDEVEANESQIRIEVEGVPFLVEAAVWNSLGIREKIMHKRNLKTLFPESFVSAS